MPRKLQRACQHPGCPKLTDSLYCAEHQQQATRHYNRFQRDPESNKRYDRAWKRICDRYIKAHPLCEQCEKDGRLMPAEEVHHILPLRHGGTNEIRNLMSLCKSCHSRITTKSGDRWHDRRREYAEFRSPDYYFVTKNEYACFSWFN